MTINSKERQELNQDYQEYFQYSDKLNEFLKSTEHNNKYNKVENEHMFLEAMFAMTDSQLRILHSYLYLTKKFDTLYPSVETIAKNSGVGKSTVQRFLKKYKNVFWFQEERQSQTYLIHVDGWLRQSYQYLIEIIKHLSNVKDRKEYLIKNCYSKGLSFKDLYESRKQDMNKKRIRMTPPDWKNDTQYSSLYSSSYEKVQEEMFNLNFNKFFSRHGINDIDLLMINDTFSRKSLRKTYQDILWYVNSGNKIHNMLLLVISRVKYHTLKELKLKKCA